MRKLYSALTLLFLSVLFFQCQQEIVFGDDTDTENNGQVATPDPIKAVIQGNVFDEAGAPAPGVTVQVGNQTATTTASGYFRINDAALDKNSSVVTAFKPGYFKAYRTFGATAGANYVNIKLIKKVSAGTVDAATGGEVSLSNGSKIALPANGVVTAATNAPYTGQVRVYAAYIDPAAADFSQTVPGSLMADDKEGRRVTLISYGMMAVELESATGEKLQIKPGLTATLTTAIPAAAQASSPATIPLWYVDETTGIWKEEGAATKAGNVYVGQVKHFSFWNCDVSQNAISLSFTLNHTGGEAFVNAKVRIRRNANAWGGVAYGWTDSLGQVKGYVPYNEPLVIEVLDQCDMPFYSTGVGPFTKHTNLGTVTVGSPGSSVVTVKGKLMTCGNTPVTNGFAVVNYGVFTHFAKVNATGDFQTSFTRCATSPVTFSIIGVDGATQQQNSSPVTVTATAPLTDAGTITACGMSASEFINYTVDGTSFSILSPADSLLGSTFGQGGGQWYTTIAGENLSNSDYLEFSFASAGVVPGSYPISSIRVNNMDSTFLTTPTNVTITNFPQNPNGFYEGSFSGQFRDLRNTTHTISATFRVRMQ